jgi:hypothetical protein
MESTIKIRGSVDAISMAFDENKNPSYYIKHFNFKGRTLLCDALIRHKELDKNLDGVFSLKQLDSIFAGKEEKQCVQ